MANEKNVVAGAFVGFKVGLQADVDTMLAAGSSAGAQHGCFYLTKDSHRLYVGNEDTSLSPVNEGIQTLTWAQLETLATSLDTADAKKAATGRFYYASDENILCVYNGTQFVQLNENTNTYVTGHTMSVSASGDTATVTDSIVQNSGGNKDASFTVTGAGGITITGTGTALTLTGDTYTLSSESAASAGTGAKIKLTSANTTNDTEVSLVAGSNVTVTGSASGITIAADDTKNTGLTITALGSSTTPTGTGFKVGVTETGGHEVSSTINPTVSWYTDASASGTTTNSANFVDGNAVLDVYSRAAIDSKLKAVNAMTYRGTVGPTGSAATSITYNSASNSASILNGSTAVPVSIGDTFLAESDGNYNGTDYKAGSLFIVRAKDGASEDPSTGIIAAGDYLVDLVKEDYNSDTTYTLTPITGGVKLVGTTDSDKGSFVVQSGDNWVDIAEASGGTTSNPSKTLTVTHADVTRTNGTGTAETQPDMGTLTIPAVTAVSSDAKGHVTGITVTNYTVKDTNASLESMSATTSAANDNTSGTVTIATTLHKANGSTSDSKNTSFTVSSTSLKITNEDAQNGPEGLAINMVWGSF